MHDFLSYGGHKNDTEKIIKNKKDSDEYNRWYVNTYHLTRTFIIVMRTIIGGMYLHLPILKKGRV